MIKINRYTRTGKTGKVIYCPFCFYREKVHNLNWSSLTSGNCQRDVIKYNWEYVSTKLDTLEGRQ